jgi:hypothetical protein
MAKNTKWKPNETQTLFLNILKGSNEPLTLAQVSHIAGVEIKSGSINTLISKEIVSTCDLEIKVKVVETEIYANGLEITKEKEKLVSKKGYAITKVGSKVAD